MKRHIITSEMLNNVANVELVKQWLKQIENQAQLGHVESQLDKIAIGLLKKETEERLNKALKEPNLLPKLEELLNNALIAKFQPYYIFDNEVQDAIEGIQEKDQEINSKSMLATLEPSKKNSIASSSSKILDYTYKVKIKSESISPKETNNVQFSNSTFFSKYQESARALKKSVIAGKKKVWSIIKKANPFKIFSRTNKSSAGQNDEKNKHNKFR